MKALSAAFSALLVNTVANSAPQYTLTEISKQVYRQSYDWSGINTNGDVIGKSSHDIDGYHALYVQYSTGTWV